MMTNLQSSAFVARTTQLLSSVANLRLLLVMLLTLTVSANVWGAEVTFNISNYASANNWTNGTAYSSANINTHLTATKGGTGDNGKYYTSNSSWRFYEANDGSITISTNSGTLQSITFTYSKGNNGVLKYNNNGINSGTACSVSGTSATFTVSHSSGTKNGNVQITSITITYTPAASCTTPPTVSSASNSNITSTTATVSCPNGITSLGSAGCSITSYGFVYGTSSNPTISNTKEQVGTTYTTTGTAFSKELTGLTANTTYYVRPYATNGNGTAYGTQTSFKTLELPKYTVTLNAGPGTCAASVTEASAGAGVTLPTPTLDGCGDWEFAGWKTTSAVTTETTTEPTLIPAGAYSPTSDITLYAVYKRTETTSGGGGGGSSTPITTDDIFENGGTYTAASGNVKAYITWTEANVISIKQEQGSSNTAVNSSYVKDPRWYASHKITITPSVNVSAITITTQGSSYTTALTGATYTNATATANSNTVTITPDNGNEDIEISMGAQARLYTLTVTYTSGSGSTTYYHSTPECSTEKTVSVLPKIMKFWQSIFGLSSG